MKNILLSAAVLSIAFVACKKDEDTLDSGSSSSTSSGGGGSSSSGGGGSSSSSVFNSNPLSKIVAHVTTNTPVSGLTISNLIFKAVHGRNCLDKLSSPNYSGGYFESDKVNKAMLIVEVMSKEDLVSLQGSEDSIFINSFEDSTFINSFYVFIKVEKAGEWRI